MNRSDPFKAFAKFLSVPGASAGSLAGLTFAAKDLFDVAGHVTGGGNPDWARTHAAASAHAPAVARLLKAGASLIGKTHTDELSRGIYGENAHFGTPINPAAPARVPGGSSSGSAVAVAAGQCDLALGTDTGGSVRAPAAFCGVLGIRPTHGRVPIAGVIAQAPSFDTVGWFARDTALLERAGQVLIDGWRAPTKPRKLVVATDLLALADPAIGAMVRAKIERLRWHFSFVELRALSSHPIADWLAAQTTHQGYEAWRSFADWIDRTNPRLGFEVADALFRNRAVTADAYAAAQRFRAARQAEVLAWLDESTVIAFATTPFIAPLRDLPRSQSWALRARLVGLMCVAGTLGAPQLSLPMGQVDGAPVGLSLLGAPNADENLLALAGRIAPVIC